VIYQGKLEGKVGGAFASAGIFGGGNETTVLSILKMMLVHGVIIQGSSRSSHFGAVAVGAPGEKAIDRCRRHFFSMYDRAGKAV